MIIRSYFICVFEIKIHIRLFCMKILCTCMRLYKKYNFKILKIQINDMSGIIIKIQ